MEFLKNNLDIFSWSHDNLPRIDKGVTEHLLNVDLKRHPVQQRKGFFTPERNKEIVEEVDINSNRDVYYLEWLATVIMVKKANWKWRMCEDFTYLNNVCLKYNFLQPWINQLIDSIVGRKLLTFIDAFLGYNQIKMNDEDQEKPTKSSSKDSTATKSCHLI